MWSKILGLFLLGVIAGVAWYHAFLSYQTLEHSNVSWVVRESSFASQAEADLLGEDANGDLVRVNNTNEGNPSEELPSAVDPCTLRDVVCEEENSIEEIISRTFPEDPRTALAIAKAESGLRADAVGVNRNGTKDAGIFQINDVHGHSLEERLDVSNNIRIAREIYDRRGWDAWSAYLNNSYLKFL